ncbi:trypsin-like serine protease [Micromonospora sp. NPDC050397]|uniref:serine protease n=1 Tax=Micromonospora sp. NPDC050397 TaxID=3364279 RepID=UPI003850D5E2
MPPLDEHDHPNHPAITGRPRRPVGPIGRAVAAALVAVMVLPGVAQADPRKPVEPAHAQPAPHGRTQEAVPEPLLPAQKKPSPKPRPGGPSTNIVGGSPAAPGEFPYFVSLQRKTTGQAFCGGSLMSTTKVLTAAHCVDGGLNPASVRVSIGGVTIVPSSGIVRDISAITVHPGWSPSTSQNDVAILTLATPIVRTDPVVQWLRLARGNELGLVDPGDTSTVIGHGDICWGCTMSNQLLKVAVPIQSDATMSTAYGADFHGPTMLGAGPLAGGKDSCQGDSGGPLVITSTPQDIQIGNVSWGNGCAEPNYPGVYGELHQGSLATFVNGQVSRPSQDQFTAASTLAGNAGSVVGTNENATVDPAEPAGETTVWYTWTPTISGNAKVTLNQHGFDSELHVYTGSSVSALTQVAYNDDANGTLQSEVDFSAVAGTTYRLRVDGYDFDYGRFRLGYGVNRPVNDDFANSQLLTSPLGVLAASTANATGQAGEPSEEDGWADATLWYTWVAPESGVARFTTYGSTFDTTLAAYTGDFLSELNATAHNDDFNDKLQSSISFPVTATSVYRIQIGGYNEQRGAVRLQFSVNPEANDLYAAAQVISGASGTVVGSNHRATAEPGEPALESAPDNTVWYRWTAPSTGTVEFRTCGSTFDTALAAATGTAVTGLTKIASNDNSGCGSQSIVSFATTARQTYYLWVDGIGAARGDVVLSWS